MNDEAARLVTERLRSSWLATTELYDTGATITG